MADRNVMLAFPHPGTVRGEFFTAMIQLVHDSESRIGEVAELTHGPGISIARNMLAKRFMESEMEWLWFCDTDMIIGPGTLNRLLAAADPVERPVVGALACIMHEGKVRATIYQVDKDTDGTFAFKHVVGELPANTLLRVDGTGTGCLLIHRDVFARISAKIPEDAGLWFHHLVIEGHEIGEDLSFCMRCAMTEIPVFVDTGNEVGHMKPVQLGNVTPE